MAESDVDKDETLVEKARSGNKDAFLLLYRRHRTPVFRFLYRFLGGAEIAEDIAHDCFLSLIRGSQKSSVRLPTLRTQLYAAARDRAIEYAESDIPRPRKSDDRAEGGRLISEVAEGVGRLPPLEREALIFFEYEGLGLGEIAAIVGSDRETVIKRLESARNRLRYFLGQRSTR